MREAQIRLGSGHTKDRIHTSSFDMHAQSVQGLMPLYTEP